MKLTERERYIAEVAWRLSRESVEVAQSVEEWLDECVDDQGHSVEELIAGQAPVQSQGSPPADCKRCEKCGGRDIHTKWVEEGEYVCPLNNGHAKKTYKMECYDKDFLRHHCRTCSFEWDTDVEPPADCKCGCESDGKIPQLEQELQAMMAKLAGVAFVAKKYHEMEYYGDNSAMLALSVADEISEILSDEPEVLAVVKGWIDLESSKGPESTLDSLSHDKYWYNDIPATVIVLRDKGEA
jgi:hypothetical protein